MSLCHLICGQEGLALNAALRVVGIRMLTTKLVKGANLASSVTADMAHFMPTLAAKLCFFDKRMK